MSGDIQAYFSTQAYASTQTESDKLRLIAITSEKRVEFLPNVPTFRELGFPQVTDQTWYALFVCSETPKPVLDKLRAVFADAMKSDAMKAQLKINGLSPYDIGAQCAHLRLRPCPSARPGVASAKATGAVGNRPPAGPRGTSGSAQAHGRALEDFDCEKARKTGETAPVGIGAHRRITLARASGRSR